MIWSALAVNPLNLPGDATVESPMAEQRKRTAPVRARRTSDGSPWAVRHRRPRDHDLKRDAVVRAAAREFNARGYHNTSLDDVAAALGVTKPTVYSP